MHFSQLSKSASLASLALPFWNQTPAPTEVPNGAVLNRSSDLNTTEAPEYDDCTVTAVTSRPTYKASILNPFDLPVSTVVVDPAVLGETGTNGVFKALQNADIVTSFSVHGRIANYLGSTTIARAQRTETFVAWKEGTVAAAASGVVAAALATAGAFSNAKRLVFATQDHATPSYVRNTSLWSPADLTGCSPWNSVGGANRAGVLVSPRHFIDATHYAIPVGTTMRFVDATSDLITRTVTGVRSIAGTDIHIGCLDADVPVTFYPVLPRDWKAKMPNRRFGIPVVCLDQEEKLLVNSMGNSPAGEDSVGDIVWQQSSLYAAWTEQLVCGDSGNPTFLLLPTGPVLLSCHDSACSGPDLAYYAPEINAAMQALGGGYTLMIADLSGYQVATAAGPVDP